METALKLLLHLLLGPLGAPSFFSILIALLLFFGVAELVYIRTMFTRFLAVLCLLIWPFLGLASLSVDV